MELQGRLPELRRKGLGLAVVSYDTPAILADFTRRRGITFPMLSDKGSATIKAYGILNTTVETTSTNYGIPFPGTFIVNREGVVTARFFEEAYQERNTVEGIFLKLGDPGQQINGKEVNTEHLQLATYLSDQVIAPGTLLSIVVDVVPHPGMHVYAPGKHDYKVIAIRIDQQPYLTVRPTRYPPSEMFEFKPLNERVEAYVKPFRLIQDVVLSASPEARKALASVKTLTITGAIDYQACDDKICYIPKSVPISYTVKVRELDTERATVGNSSR